MRNRMRRRHAPWRLAAFIACLLVLPCMARADEVGRALVEAARLHKGGETAAALAIWQRWAERGNVDAVYNLAVVHQHGDGVAVDYDRAMQWYRFAAERGDRVSQYMLGQMYLEGQGVPVDKEAAHRWFAAHRAHHAHHDHTPQMQAWRRQAAALIQERDLREALAASRQNGEAVVAGLRRRAGLEAAPPLADASAGDPASHRW
ncbi:MAG: sel1 repeat family protein [Caenispirillum sp.]|nr:sel1 repeat family protein [Caenispirillum sp.]